MSDGVRRVTSTRDSGFAGASELASATPIDPRAEIGALALTVRDLDGAVAYYTERLGFAPRSRSGPEVRLGAGDRDLLVLDGLPDAPRLRGTAGLYHFAVLVPSRRDLALALRHLLATRTPLTGASDHGVSEALYLSDPEGNGIEIYRDRLRTEWPVSNGRLSMVLDPLDLDDLLGGIDEREPRWTGLEPGTRIGHMHLQVSRLDEAVRFYSAVVGFDVMQHMGGAAAFLSAGGYHHHLGLNTWAGEGAPPPPDGAAGLREFEIVVSNRSELDRVVARARAGGVAVEAADGAAVVTDPSNHRVRIVVGR